MTGSAGPAGGGDAPDAGAHDPSRGTPEERLQALGWDEPPASGASTPVDRPSRSVGTAPPQTDGTEARVAAELAALPSPPLPAHVLARVDRALAEERARARSSLPAGVHPGGGPRPRRRRVLVAPVAAVLLVVAVALGVTVRAGDGSPTPTAAPAPSGTIGGAPPSPGTGGVRPALRRGDLPRALRAGLGAADAGPLTDPRRLAACLRAQPVPATPPVVGARRVVLDGDPGVLLVLPTGVAARFRLLVVGEGCGADGPSTLADTVVGR